MKTIHIEFSDEHLITSSGLVFVGQIPGKSSFVKKINRTPVLSEYLQNYYKYAPGIAYAIPSAETLRQRFGMIGDSRTCKGFEGYTPIMAYHSYYTLDRIMGWNTPFLLS